MKREKAGERERWRDEQKHVRRAYAEANRLTRIALLPCPETVTWDEATATGIRPVRWWGPAPVVSGYDL